MCPEGPPSVPTALAARLAGNLRAVRERLDRAAERCGREGATVRLLAVTKYVEPAIAEAMALTMAEEAGTGAGPGVRERPAPDLGESRVQELQRKHAWFADRRRSVRWHMIGHVQRNKARRAVQLADVIHSVDSLRLLEALERTALEERVRPRVFFELRLVDASAGDGPARTGFEPDQLEELMLRARDLEALIPVGLMTMGPRPDSAASEAGDDPLARQAPARAVFAQARQLRERLLDRHAEVFEHDAIRLSTGMSSDLEAAVAEGSDLVRVGSALFEGVEVA